MRDGLAGLPSAALSVGLSTQSCAHFRQSFQSTKQKLIEAFGAFSSNSRGSVSPDLAGTFSSQAIHAHKLHNL